MDTGRFAMMASIAALLSVGCFKPNISDGGFLCGAGNSCPEGFRCGFENRCWRGDAGPDTGPCTVPAPAPLCAAPPGLGEACNPTCQTGCRCGRCVVGNGGPSCDGIPGPKALGESCSLAQDDCEPGLGCVRESCGTNLGRCFKFCATSADCPNGLSCSDSFNGANGNATGFFVCEQAPQACNPVGGAASGCPAPELGCYIVSPGRHLCDCIGTRQTGQSCALFNECQPGNRCIQLAGMTTGTCVQVCESNADCTLPEQCRNVTQGFGRCAP
jgi:hypothetical protein